MLRIRSAGVKAVFLAALLVLCSGIALAAGDQGESATLSAPPSGEPTVELKDERTATSQMFLLPDGARETRIFDNPINYRDDEGHWQPIDEGLEELPSGAITNGENSFDIRLPEHLGVAPVRFSVGDEWLTFKLRGSETEAAELSPKTASYEASDPGTTFEYASLADGLKEDIEIADPSQPSTFHFELGASDDLTPNLSSDGSIQFLDAEKDIVAVMPAPVMSDSAGAVSHDVHYSLESRDQGGWELTVEADREWLSDPQRAWPAQIDPTLKVGPTLDCMYSGSTGKSGSSACGSTGSQELKARYHPSLTEADSWSRSALKFNLGAVPKEAYVSEASVSIHSPAAALNTTGVELRASGPWNQFLNWRYRDEKELWTKEGGDFNNEGGEVLTSQRGTQAGWWNVPLTALARRWTGNEIPNYGLILKLKDDLNRVCNGTSCTERLVKFDSSAATDANNRPYISVGYYLPAPATTKIALPTAGTQTARRFKLKASWSAAGITGVTYQFREKNSKEQFQTIPQELVKNAQGQSVTWPVPLSTSPSEPLYFDAAHASSALKSHGGEIQLRALFEGPPNAGGYTVPVDLTVDRFIGGTHDASAQVGPGSVDLLTGNLTVSRTDVSIAGFGSALEFNRTLSSRDAESGQKSVLGQGWKPGALVEMAGGSEWRSVREFTPSAEEAAEGVAPYATLTDLEGYEYAFERKPDESYVTPPELAGWVLYRQTGDSTHFYLTDTAGNRTTFELQNGEYMPVSVSQAGGAGNKTRMVYQLEEGVKRLSMIIAPTAAGVTCPEGAEAESTPGCRVLGFFYQPGSDWGISGLGPRLAYIMYFGPETPTANGHWEVAHYNYNTKGQLTEEWDPRLGLKEKYTYETGGQLHTITPPGLEPWTMEYGAIDGEQANGRLMNVKRASLLASPTTAQTTIAYGVPTSGSGAPYDMSGSAVAQWGQQDIPTDATAIFPPDQVPANPPASYSRATLYYLDAEGMQVNGATPSGAGTSAPSITTTEPDEHGNIVRELSAQNRLRSLAAGAGSIAKSHELEGKRTFSADGTEMLEEWGPLHQVRLESGSIVQARLHRTVQYDEGAPAPPPGTPMPHLPTRETTGASVPGQGIDADQRVTETHYNWTLRKPTEAIVDPLGLNLHTRVEYDASSGLPTERSLPAKSSGGDAHTTKTIYYSAGTQSPDPVCQSKPAWANLPCKVLPAAQPGTPGQPELLVRKFTSYNQLGEPTEVIESPGGSAENTRKTITTYDTAGRSITQKLEGGGTAIPKVESLYSSTTGRPTTQRFVCEAACEGFDNQAVTTTYDALGRPTSYQDADGNTSTVTYDLLGRPVTTNDGKGTQTRAYDPTSGLLTELQDSAAGTFTASYDADGNLVERGLPDGLVAKTTYDETGAPAHLSYTKTSNCGTSCTWLDFGAERSIYGQVLAQASTLSAQQYSYDKAGRLALTKDTPQGGSCVTRSYSFDKDSNRTALVTRAPGLGGACDTNSGGTSQTYEYDAGDRLLGTGLTYDNFGRITSLPSSYAGGGSALTTSYFSNDMVASQSQGGVTNTFQLDAVLRQRQRIQGGGLEGTEVFHYANPSDSPAWTERGSVWSRNVAGIGGELAAIQDSSSGTTLQLTNLHGDVVATASLSPTATELLGTSEYDEFGNPVKGSPARFGWLGGKQRRTELPSGVIQMGARSYVPAMGRFISLDAVLGGSANGYDYANGNPVNEVDLSGESPGASDCTPGFAGCQCKLWAHLKKGQKRGTFYVTTVRKCNRTGGITLQGYAAQWYKKGNAINAPQVVYPEITAACTGLTDPCQNYQKSSTVIHCDPGKTYELSITWGFVYNLYGEGAEHYLHVSVQQTCPRGSS
jgi:RHS repeat-associated protein